MIKSKRVNNGFGKVRVIEGWNNIHRLFVKRTSCKTYVASTSETLSFDSMVMVDGDYHFSTLKELHTALNAPIKETV